MVTGRLTRRRVAIGTARVVGRIAIARAGPIPGHRGIVRAGRVRARGHLEAVRGIALVGGVGVEALVIDPDLVGGDR